MPTSIRRRRSTVVARDVGAERSEGSGDVRAGTLFDEHAQMVLASCRYHLRDPQAAGAHGVLVVPSSLREQVSRLIPELDPAGTAAGVASGAGGAAALAGHASAPLAAKVATTGAAAVAPLDALVSGDAPRGP